MENNKNYSEKCPECGKIGGFIPPSITDKKRKKLIVTFKCSNGHKFTKEFDLK